MLIACALMFAAPALAQDAMPPQEPPSLIERGARMFLKGLMEEARPAMRDMQDLADQMGPALRDFAREMGPALADILDQVDDFSAYQPPEMLPNGDIIIRRRTPRDTPEVSPPDTRRDEIEI